MNLNIVDYNDLYVIAVGICMTYILVNKKEEQKNFFAFLQNIGKSIYSWFVSIASSKLMELDRLQKKVEYLLSENESSAEYKNTIVFIKERIKKHQ